MTLKEIIFCMTVSIKILYFLRFFLFFGTKLTDSLLIFHLTSWINKMLYNSTLFCFILLRILLLIYFACWSVAYHQKCLPCNNMLELIFNKAYLLIMCEKSHFEYISCWTNLSEPYSILYNLGLPSLNAIESWIKHKHPLFHNDICLMTFRSLNYCNFQFKRNFIDTYTQHLSIQGYINNLFQNF